MTLKERIIKFLHHSKIYSKKQIISAAIFPAALIYFEAIFRIISVKEVPGFWWWLAMICASIVGGLLLTMLCTVTKNEKINNIIEPLARLTKIKKREDTITGKMDLELQILQPTKG